MKHLGDICWINGAEIDPVDVIIGGSPCQDLSVAGKQVGLTGERSGLFMEQIRIIKEMRASYEQRAAKFIRPRFMVWENVPGAFSSNKGADFRTVLEETARIVQPDAYVPEPPKGKWSTSGCIMGNGWSIAWRVFDAQFWGVPQRRRRIALIADFGGYAAPEILFERKSLFGDTEQGAMPGQTVAARIGKDAYSAVAVNKRGINPPSSEFCAGFDYHAGSKAGSIGYQIECALALKVDNQMAVFENHGQDGRYTGPLNVSSTCSQHWGTGGNNMPLVAATSRVAVRRLMPLECERLQGYPDGWTDIGEWMDSKGKLHKESSDTARYKALGNSIALPPWRWVLLRLAAQYCRLATMGSLFDGIGGFPLLWESINGKGSCLWASEVDEFCIAVTKQRFASEQSKRE